ncbi:MAG: DHH family phosphoesterase [Ignisphaera sp.]
MRKIIEDARRVAIITHVNADPDALSSACALYKLIYSLNNNAFVEILVPEGIGLECKRIYKLCQRMNTIIDVIKRHHQLENKEPCDTCIIVDTASWEQLRIIKNYVFQCNNIIVIDHHQYQDIQVLDKSKKILFFGDEQYYSSTAEIVFEMIVNYNQRLGNLNELATILLAGILWDTKRFQRIAKNTFRVVAKMIDLGADYEEAMKLIAVEKPPSNRIARIKCILRHRGFKIRIKNSEVFIAISNVGAYESDCASSLISIGYDISFVVTEDEDLKATRVVYRGRDEVVNALDIDIYNNILKKLVDVYGGGGGGHKVAGGAVLRTYNVKHVIEQLIKVLNSISEIGILEFVEERS